MMKIIQTPSPVKQSRMMAHFYVGGKEILRNAISDETATAIKNEASKLAKPGSLSSTLSEEQANGFIKFLNNIFHISLNQPGGDKVISNIIGVENLTKGIVDFVSFSNRSPNLPDSLKVLFKF